MIDQNSRDRLLKEQENNRLINSVAQAFKSTVPPIVQPVNPKAEELTQKIGELNQTIQKTQIVNPKPLPLTPAMVLANEMRTLHRSIGQGSLIDTIKTLSSTLHNFELEAESVNNLKALVTDMSEKIKLLTEIEAKIPTEIKVQLKEELNGMEISGTVDVASIGRMPDVKITNLSEVSQAVTSLTQDIKDLTNSMVMAIKSTKTTIPSSFKIDNQVEIKEWSELIDGIEELKKGFNLLINKEAGTVNFPSNTIPVEIQNWKIAQPVTSININPLRGAIKSTAITVTSTATLLPTTSLADRRSLSTYNNGSSTLYIGGSDVTTANGIPVPAGTWGPEIDAGPRMLLYGTVASSSLDVRVLEMSNDDVGGTF